MERLPPTEFGRTLRALVRLRWKTQASFAGAIAVDETWVAKVIRGDQNSLTYASLEKLLAGFKSPDDQEQLYRAWLSTYAPSPSERTQPDQWSTDEQVVSYARSTWDRISAGNILPTIKTLRSLWRSLRNERQRCLPALEVGGALVEAALQLDRVSLALEMTGELGEMSRSNGEPEWTARSLWLRGLSLRLCRPRRLLDAESAFGDFDGYLAGWQPRSSEGSELHDGLSRIAARDSVLSALDLVRAGQASNDELLRRIRLLGGQLPYIKQSAEIGLFSEILARALIAAGIFDEATEHLQQAGKLVVTKPNELKVLICRIQWLQATGHGEEAIERLSDAQDFADGYSLVHHRQKLAVIQTQLEAPTSARTFPMGREGSSMKESQVRI